MSVEPRFNARFIAGSTLHPTIASYYGLPQSIDDAEAKYGSDIYDKMLHDPDLQGFMNGLKATVLEHEPQVLPSHDPPSKYEPATPEEESDYKKSKEIADFVSLCHDLLPYSDRPISEVLWDMLEALSHGHRLAEIVFRPGYEGMADGKWVLDSIAVKPRQNYAFVTDNHNRLLGVTGKVPGIAPHIRQGLIGDPSGLPNFVPREKLFCFAPYKRNGDPRGSSLLRGAYIPWKKDQYIHEEHLKFISQFGGGMITAELGEKTETGKLTHPVTGEQVEFSEYIGLMLQNMGNGQYGVFPNGTKVTVHQPTSDGKAFEVALEANRRQKALAVTTSIRAFLEAKHSSKADSETADDALHRFIRNNRRALADAYRMTVVYQLVKANFGDQVALKYLPRIELGEESGASFAESAQGLKHLGVQVSEGTGKMLIEKLLGVPHIEDEAEAETGDVEPAEDGQEEENQDDDDRDQDE